MSALVAYVDSNGKDVITAKSLATLFAGTTGTAVKFGVKNVGDRSLGDTLQAAIEEVLGNAGWEQVRLAQDPDTLSPPWDVEATLSDPSDGGVYGATGTYGWVVTSYNATGETIASDEVTVAVDVTTKRVELGWAEVTGATGYRGYRTPTPGTYGASTRRFQNVGQGNTTFTDDGTATSSGTPPSANTTGGAGPAYGTPPSDLEDEIDPIALGQDAGTLAIGEMDFFWINRVVPSNASEGNNPHRARIRVTEEE